ncbi:MAG: DNA starvation/stationary phase protection protein [Lewinellaceae bacterium]|nr:DNA starvation/stationary phase protection protein [Lewinellaceae bacterium]
MSLTTDQLTKGNAEVNIGIQQKKREGAAEMLKHLLADEHVLYIKLRNYHWNVTGIHFKPLHAFFEEQYTAMAGHIDDIAERIRSLGFFAPGSMEEFKAYARLEETQHLNGDAQRMLENLLHGHEAIIQYLRKDQDAALEQYQDAGTQDFLIGLMEAHEKMAWMVRSHLV